MAFTNFSANSNNTIAGNLGSVGTLSAGIYVVRVLDSLDCIENVTINEGSNPVLIQVHLIILVVMV